MGVARTHDVGKSGKAFPKAHNAVSTIPPDMWIVPVEVFPPHFGIARRSTCPARVWLTTARRRPPRGVDIARTSRSRPACGSLSSTHTIPSEGNPPISQTKRQSLRPLDLEVALGHSTSTARVNKGLLMLLTRSAHNSKDWQMWTGAVSPVTAERGKC